MGTDYYAKLVCGVKIKPYFWDKWDNEHKIQVSVGGSPAFDADGKPIMQESGRRIFNFTNKTYLSTGDRLDLHRIKAWLKMLYGLEIITCGCEDWVVEDDMIGIWINNHYEEDPQIKFYQSMIETSGLTAEILPDIIDFVVRRLENIGITEKPHIDAILHVDH